jgi:DNA-binding transcriptional regulator YhcF (GntR family)
VDFWHAIETEIFKNDSLDIYEKMCLLVLMSQGEEVHLTSAQLASYMGCGLNTAKRAFESLRIKGYLAKDYQASPAIKRESNVVKNEEAVGISKPLKEVSDDFQAGFFTDSIESGQKYESKVDKVEHQSGSNQDVDPEMSRRRQMAAYLLGDEPELSKAFVSKKVTNQSLTDQVIGLVDEKISSKEANIILAFANNDIEVIKKKYMIAKQSQLSDTIGVLINELQKKDSAVIKTDDSTIENSQVDTNRLLKMQAYQNSRFKK